MIDIDKQIDFWRDSAREDLAGAHELVNKNRVRHGLFFAHLALEKILKAHVCRVTRDIPLGFAICFVWLNLPSSTWKPPPHFLPISP